jgi:hypothetical protein
MKHPYLSFLLTFISTTAGLSSVGRASDCNCNIVIWVSSVRSRETGLTFFHLSLEYGKVVVFGLVCIFVDFVFFYLNPHIRRKGRFLISIILLIRSKSSGQLMFRAVRSPLVLNTVVGSVVLGWPKRTLVNSLSSIEVPQSP